MLNAGARLLEKTLAARARGTPCCDNKGLRTETLTLQRLEAHRATAKKKRTKNSKQEVFKVGDFLRTEGNLC